MQSPLRPPRLRLCQWPYQCHCALPLFIAALAVSTALAQAPKDAPSPPTDPTSALEFLGSYAAPSAVLATETSHTSAHPPSPSADRRLRQLGGAAVLPPWPADFAWPPEAIAAACDQYGQEPAGKTSSVDDHTWMQQARAADVALRAERFGDAAAADDLILKQRPACAPVAWNRAVARAYSRAPTALPDLVAAAPGAPATAAGRLLIGLERLANGELDAARSDLAIPLNSTDGGQRRTVRERDSLWAQAMWARVSSDGAKSRQILERLSALEPDSAPVWFALGNSALEEARADSRRLTEVAPDSAWNRRLESEALAARYPLLARKVWPGDQSPDDRRTSGSTGADGADSPEQLYVGARAALQTAETAFRNASRSPRFNAELHALRALAAEQQNDEAAALQEYRAGLADDPGSAVLHAGLGHCYRERSEFDAARRELTEALRLDSTNALAAFELGDVSERLGQPDRALDLLDRALELDPALLIARWSRGKAYLALGDSQRALADLEAAAPVDTTGELQWQLARLYRKLGRTELAEAAEQRSQEQRSAQSTKAKAESDQ